MDEKLALKFDDKGLITAVVVDDATDEVLMVAWMNDEAVKQTLATRKATFYSRSRKKMWVKGEESGHVQEVKSVRVDCDQDTLVVRVDADGRRLPRGIPELLLSARSRPRAACGCRREALRSRRRSTRK